MGNKAGGQATQAVETVRKRLTIRRRNPQDESEFSALEIQRKFNNMPNLTEEEKKVLRSSWDIISQKVDQVRKLFNNLFIGSYLDFFLISFKGRLMVKNCESILGKS
jgi:hypothetical protein